MDRVFFEGIRCFAKRQEVPLAPLTVLVGENSSGKSTVLALIRLAWDMAAKLHGGIAAVNFNEEPFLLGAYAQIAAAPTSQAKAGLFTLGIETILGTAEARFEDSQGQAVLVEKVYASSSYEKPYRVLFRFGRAGGIESIQLDDPENEKILYGWLRLGELGEDLFGRLSHFIESFESRPFAFAPIRTRPRRTYDPIGLITPEGDHVPVLLAGSALLEGDRMRDLLPALESFGQVSGLFAKVEVRKLGDGESDPFQIQVYIGDKPVNLIDVGYGVSQVLPIVVDCLRGEPGATYLLQQPEVHLHPRAQAELGSFLGVLAKQQNKRFVIETHSDYLVDRIRMDIRDKKGITPEDVALLYFERKNGEATIHRLALDDQGNILNAPPGYRSFFLEEERRFLGG